MSAGLYDHFPLLTMVFTVCRSHFCFAVLTADKLTWCGNECTFVRDWFINGSVLNKQLALFGKKIYDVLSFNATMSVAVWIYAQAVKLINKTFLTQR